MSFEDKIFKNGGKIEINRLLIKEGERRKERVGRQIYGSK